MKRLTHLLTLCILIALVGAPLSAQATGIASKLTNFQEEQESDSITNEGERKANAARQKAMANLASALARTSLVPQVLFSKGQITKEDADGRYHYEAPVRFNRSQAFTTRLAEVKRVLKALPPATRSICIRTPTGPTERFNLTKAAEAQLLKALRVGDIEPVPMHKAQMEGRTVVLSSARLGEDLYDVFTARVSSGQGNTVTLGLTPQPEWQPVRLSLTTTEGQRITIPVELDGADRRLEIRADTRWVVDGQPTDIAFDQGNLGQIVLLSQIVRKGEIKLQNITRADYYPVHRHTLDEGFSYDMHLLGESGTWFSQISYEVRPKMTVQYSAGSCSLRVRFAPSDDTAVDLGGLMEHQWKRVSERVKVIATGTARPVIGYVSAPKCSSNPAGLNAKAFDKVMALPKRCATLCRKVATAAQSISATYDEDGEVIQDAVPAQSFSQKVCTDTCVERSAYKTCLQKKVRGDARKRYNGLLNCETRRKISK